MKKQMKIFGLVIVLLYVFTNFSYGVLSARVGLHTANSKITRGEKVEVVLAFRNLQAGEGIVALAGVLDYDRTSLVLEEIEGENKWSGAEPNEANGRFAITRSSRMKQDGNILKLIFKVKENAGESVWVRLSNVEISDGNEEINLGGANLNLAVQEKIIEPEPPVIDQEPVEEKPVVTKKPTMQTSSKKENESTNQKETEKPEQQEQQELLVENEIIPENVMMITNTIQNEVGNTQIQETNIIRTIPVEGESSQSRDYIWIFLLVMGIIFVFAIGMIIYILKKK